MLANPELSMIFGASFGPSGQFLAFTGWDYYRNTEARAPTPAEIWDFASGQRLHTLAVGGIGLQPAFSADGRLLAFGGSSAPVSLWDITTGKLMRALKDRGDAAFSPDGRLLAVAEPAAITIHDIATDRIAGALLPAAAGCDSAPTARCWRKAAPEPSRSTRPRQARSSAVCRTARGTGWTRSFPSQVQ